MHAALSRKLQLARASASTLAVLFRSCGMVNKRRLILALIRDAAHEEDRQELRQALWGWLALGVIKLAWKRRLWGLLGNRLNAVKHHGRLHAIRDDDDEESQQRPRPRPRPKRR